jgi:hypothetical protein
MGGSGLAFEHDPAEAHLGVVSENQLQELR